MEGAEIPLKQKETLEVCTGTYGWVVFVARYLSASSQAEELPVTDSFSYN